MALTRKQMVEIIKAGRSVLWQDPVTGQRRVINHLDQLPSAAQLAGNDPDALTATLADLDAQISDLNAQRKQVKTQLDAAQKAAKAAEQQDAGSDGAPTS